MQFTSYNSIQEKSQWFDANQTLSFNELKTELESGITAGRFNCFRGQADALWRIVSSSQRRFLDLFSTNKLIPTIVAQRYMTALSTARYYGPIDNILDSILTSAYHIWLNELAYRVKTRFPWGRFNICNHLPDNQVFGFMQHYNGYSPFVDFSSDWRVALFMATHSTPEPKPTHFSIYAYSDNVCQGNETFGLEEVCYDHDSTYHEFNSWCNCSWIIRKQGTAWNSQITKGRMASQGGMFVYSSKCPGHSLESLFSEFSELELGLTQSADKELRRIICFNIPYSEIDTAKAFCKQANISHNTLGLRDTNGIDNIMKNICDEACLTEQMFTNT